MELADLLNDDPNTLPYFITEAQTSRKVLVRFEPLAIYVQSLIAKATNIVGEEQ